MCISEVISVSPGSLIPIFGQSGLALHRPENRALVLHVPCLGSCLHNDLLEGGDLSVFSLRTSST